MQACIESAAEDLKRANAPRKVVEAGEYIDAAIRARLRPSKELVDYVQNWVARNRGNDRYGK